MPRTCIVYSTTDGHTLEICQRIQQLLQSAGHQSELIAVDAATNIDWSVCDKIVIGARIRYGKHHPDVRAFIERHLQQLQARPGAFFSVNVVARKPGKDTVAGNPYLQKFLKTITWRPTELAVFAGKIDYRKYRLGDRLMIRFIMWLTRGPTQPDACVDFTDWQAVADFARHVAAMGTAPAAPLRAAASERADD
ncbi:MAG TPA: menaquinone-dependent protoporphyrinogen IX dehydrogenase [Xanthomonadales bacterium]|nr:menaquinone-dependent protoporphyrinogen IX dehydrogenase [Xanthomonadales bacterium]